MKTTGMGVSKLNVEWVELSYNKILEKIKSER